MGDVQRAFLRRLRDAGPDGLAASSVPARCESLVEQLKICGAAEIRLGKGRGFRLHLRDLAVFANYIESQYPAGLDIAAEDLVDRASAVALLGDAKAVRHGSHRGIFVRSVKRNVTMDRADTAEKLPIGELTVTAGGAAIVIGAGIEWRFTGFVAIIENAETFWRYEFVLPEVDLAIFAQGRMSERVLAWLASPLLAGSHFIHWGDYDPVGAAEYLRLITACPGRVQMHLPADLEVLLSKYGKSALVAGQTDVLDGLRDSADDPTVMKLVTLFDKYGRGLEQEILLAVTSSGPSMPEIKEGP
jgi:hypothetical protein